MKIIPVILSGGSGTRLWPLSRKQYPKQYLSLAEEQTMLQATLQRLNGINNLSDPVVICNVESRFLVAEQLHQIGIKNPTIILEPVGKNTAPAIAAAAQYIELHSKGDNLLLVLSADHLILDVQAFHQAIKTAAIQAETGKLVTFGIKPTEPNTGYGYIKIENTLHNPTDRGSEVKIQTSNDVQGDKTERTEKVEKFIEKPDKLTAKRYLADGNYLWNSGMFIFTAQRYLQELGQYNPEMSAICKDSVEHGQQDYDFFRLNKEIFTKCPSDSIDYAVMEKTTNATVVTLDAGWNDIGSWSALWDIAEKDSNNNVTKGDVIAIDTADSYIRTDGGHLVATIGVEQLVVVITADATLIATKDKAQQVKQIVEQLQHQKRCEEQLHRKVYRPWGWYDSVDKGDRFQVKRICVNPGSSLSLQKHMHRAEHWIVVKGVAKITNGNSTELLSEDQSTYIPVGNLHRLENPGKLPLEMIEIQSGDYLGEDDIERFEDSYGRVEQ